MKGGGGGHLSKVGPVWCCDTRLTMEDDGHAKIILGDDPDTEFWLVNDDGRIVALIDHCPWCGSSLAGIQQLRDTGST